MGRRFFGVDLGGILKREFERGLTDLAFKATLTKFTPGTRTAGRSTAGNNPTSSTHSCLLVLSNYAEGMIDGTRIQVGDRKALIFTDSISPAAVPAANDQLTAEGLTYRVIEVMRDPVAATYTLQVRGGR